MLLSELKLKETIKNPGFKIPDDYFDTVENDIINKVKPAKKTKVIKLNTWKKLSFAGAVAASLVIMFSLIFSNNSLNLNKIETASIENYILNEDLDNSDIASLFKDVDLTNMSLTNNNISSESLENYVLDNLDFDELIINNK